MIFDNIRRKIFRIFLFALFILLSLFSNDLFFDIPDKTEWLNSAFTGVTGVIDILPGHLSILISIMLALISGMLIYKISFDHLSITGREHLLVWLWVIQVGGFSFLHPLQEVHFATVFILMSYDSLFQIYRKTSDYKEIFMSFMYLGIATFFYSFSIYLFIPYMISLYRFKIASFRDWIISIAGFLVPFYFGIFIFHFWVGDWLYPIETTINNIIPNGLTIGIAGMKTSQYILCGFIATLIVAGMVMYMKSMRQGINQKTISCMRSFSTLMLFSILIFLFFTPDSKLMIQIILIPSTIYLRILFVKITKNIIANSLFVLLIAASVITLLY
ncbi:MAG: hypothetical protein LBE04_04840 [Prevotellaceae bacterium]|nr:hypothetical protein [Prevotellaceae bacterium]